jgi:hypothetical protein
VILKPKSAAALPAVAVRLRVSIVVVTFEKLTSVEIEGTSVEKVRDKKI